MDRMRKFLAGRVNYPHPPVGKTLQMDVSVTPFHFAYSASVVDLTTKFFC